MPEHFDHKVSFVYVKACVVDRLTPQTPNLEVRVSLDKVLYSALSSPRCIDAWVPATYCWGGGNPAMNKHPIQGGSSNIPRHDSVRLGLWLGCAFTLPLVKTTAV